ncbi:hypothetical protein GmHk_12G033628 [Glycine max]|nr:hypothetical protein GmHk_12G033628 [Glycine max]
MNEENGEKSDNTYKTNKYMLFLLNIVGVIPTGMTFSAAFAYLEGEHIKNVVWVLERVESAHWALKRLLQNSLGITSSLWPMFVDYVESAHWALKRLLQNSLGDLCNVWEVMNNMITLRHIKIKTSFKTSTHVIGHVFKVTLYKKLLGKVSRYALNQIAGEFERVNYVCIDSSRCGCIMRTTYGLPCACELARYVVGSISLDTIHMFWRRLSFSNQGLSKPEVTIIEEMKAISKRCEEIDVCGKVTLRSKLWEIVYPDLNFMCVPPKR